jgi:phosphoenolpyruvate carboxykinase (GTP)
VDAVRTPLGLQPRYEDLEWVGLESFTRERFEELTRVDPQVWRKEVKDHAELFDKLKARMPQELYALREELERAL